MFRLLFAIMSLVSIIGLAIEQTHRGAFPPIVIVMFQCVFLVFFLRLFFRVIHEQSR